LVVTGELPHWPRGRGCAIGARVSGEKRSRADEGKGCSMEKIGRRERRSELESF